MHVELTCSHVKLKATMTVRFMCVDSYLFVFSGNNFLKIWKDFENTFTFVDLNDTRCNGQEKYPGT